MCVRFWQFARSPPCNMPRFYDQPIKLPLKNPAFSLNISGNIKDHTLQEARVQLGTAAIQASPLLSPASPLPRSCFSAASSGGERGEGGGSFSSCVRVHHVSRTLLAPLFCLADSPPPAVFASWLKICVPQRQETLSPPHSISYRLCSHLADTGSSADAFSPCTGSAG